MPTIDEQRQFLSRRALHLILMPTERCNFRCTYCYEDFHLGRMSSAVVASVKALVLRRVAELDFLCIEWFGGEPLLASDLVLELQEWVVHLRRDHPALRFSGQMTTNGYLLEAALFRRLLATELRKYQISIDGPAALHDRQRVLANGKGTFEVIWANLLAMREEAESFEVLLRVHATRENLGALGGFVKELAATFGGDSRFRLSLRPVEKLGGPNDRQLATLDEDERRALEALKTTGESAGMEIHAGPFAEPGSLQGCYAAAANSYVVRSNGEIAKCTVALRHPENRVGVLREDGTLALDSGKMFGWMRGVFSGDASALICPMNGLVEPRAWEGPLPVSPLVTLGRGTRAAAPHHL